VRPLATLAVAVVFTLAGCGDDTTRTVDMSVGLDLAPTPPECDVLENRGCPAGEKCTVGVEAGNPRDLCFRVAAAPLPADAACAPVTVGDRTGDDCAPGLICVDLPGSGGGRCRRPCYQRHDCASGQGCVVLTATSTLRSDDAGTFALHACASDTACDPVAQSGCAAGTGCYLSVADDEGRIGLCLSAGPGQVGATCARLQDCAPGLRCEGLGFCRHYCYFEPRDGGVPGTCPPSEGVCDRFAFSPTQYGVCGAQ
jgi:hypothetical protein